MMNGHVLMKVQSFSVRNVSFVKLHDELHLNLEFILHENFNDLHITNLKDEGELLSTVACKDQ